MLSAATLFLKRLTIFTASLAFAFSFSLLAIAWSGPPASPPSENIEVITAGAFDQVKAGNLAVEVLIADRVCIGEKCLTEWPEF